MRRIAKSGLSLLLAASLMLSSGSFGLTAGAETAAVDDKIVKTIARAFPNDIDPDARMDEVLDNGIHEWSTVDTSQFIQEDDIEQINTGYVKAQFDTQTQNGGSANTAFWESKHLAGWTVGRGRYVWLRFDLSDKLNSPEYQDYNLVQANVHITHRHGLSAGDTYKVRYIPDNSWTEPVYTKTTDKTTQETTEELTGWTGEDLTFNSQKTYFDQGIDVGGGYSNGSTSSMKTNTLTADGLVKQTISSDGIISLCLYGEDGGSGGEIASLDLIEENNGNQKESGSEPPQPLIDGYEPSLQLVYSNANQQQTEYLIDRPYALSKMEEIVKEYDNAEVAASFTPLGNENDVTVTYSVEDEASKPWVTVSDDMSKINIIRPDEEQGDQDVIIGVKTQRNNVIFTYDLKMTIMARQGASPTAQSSMESVIEFCETTLAEQKAADNITSTEGEGNPGQLSGQKAEELEQAIAEAKGCTDVGRMSNMTNVLLSKGQEFMGSGIISNEILYQSRNKYLDQGNTLVYSEYRAKLQALVWRAKATLLVDPSMYPKSAKKALQVEINRAEQALKVDKDGSSMLKLPFTKTRMFYAEPDDSMIQYATSYSTKFHNYNAGTYGLEPVLDWYATEHMLYDAYSTVEVEPSFMGYIHNSNKDTWNSGSLIVGKTPDDRIAMFQFDLSKVDGAIQSAKIRLVADNGNAHQCTMYLEEDDFEGNGPTWNQMAAKNGSYQSAGVGVVSGNAIGSYKPAGKDAYSYGTVTDAAIAEAAGDGILTFSMQINETKTFANDLYGTNNATKVTQLPVLLVKTADSSVAVLKKSIETLIDNQKELLESTGTYSGDVKNAEVGQFSKSTHDAAIAAMAKVESDLKDNTIDLYALAQDAVKFLDAAYDCRMSIALLSDIDVDEDGNQKGNIFYSEEDIQELKQLIKTNDNIKKAYQDMKDAMQTVKLDASEDYWEKWRNNDKALWDENPAFATPAAATGGKYTSGRHVNNEAGQELPANLNLGSATEKKEEGEDGIEHTIQTSAYTYTNKAYITIELESEDNDTTGYSNMSDDSGCGEAWIDNMTITSDDGNNVEIPNANFETSSIDGKAPLNWTLTTTGRGEGRWESGKANVASGNRSLYLHNPDGNSSVTWKSSQFDLPILSSKDGFDITFGVKQYGIFEDKGVQVKFHFLKEKTITDTWTDADGEEHKEVKTVVDEEVSRPNYYNAKGKPTVTGVGSYTIIMQRAAILAMLADSDAERTRYAKIAKTYIYLFLDEFNQGVENWLAYDNRPDGIDAYGAVQGGRGAGSLATAYSLVKNMKDADGNPIFTEAEKEELTESAYYLMRDLNDIRDRYELSYEETSSGGTNWASDMNMGAAMLGLAFDDTMEDARAHFYNGMRVDEAMLLVNIRKDGSWPESLRYHNAAISKLAVMAKCLRASTGFDWYANKDLEFYRSFDYLTYIQTPRYASGNASTPFFGDHNLSKGDELYMCGLYYDEVADSHPDVALRMYATWVNAGTPAPSLSGDDNQLQALFGHTVDINDYGNYKDSLTNLGSTDYAKYFGMYIMRNNFMEKGSESYLVTVIQDEETGHNHKDQLSFIMYADNVPLVVDPGSSPSYWGGSKSNYIGNTQHSLVAYAQDNKDFEQDNDDDANFLSDFYDTGVTSELRGFYMSDSLDVSKGTTSHTKADGELKRDIAFIKNGFEAVVVWDQVTGAEENGTMMNLPLYTRCENAITRNGNKFTAKMFGGIDLEITALDGECDNYKVKTLNINGSYQKREDEDDPKADHLRIRHKGNDGYLTVLFPKTKQRGALATEDLGNGVYKLSHSSGNSVYLVVNEGKTEKTVTLPEKNLYDLESLNQNAPTIFAEGTVSVPKYSMKLLTTKVTTTQEVAAEGTGKPSETPQSPQPGQTTGSSTPGAAAGGAGGGAAAPSNDTTNYVTGNNSRTDLSVPGVVGIPAASMNNEKAMAGKLTFQSTGNAEVYYSVNGSDYQKYDRSVTLSDGKNTVTYFTVDANTGIKTRGISEVLTVASAVGSAGAILEDADTAVSVSRNLATGQKGRITVSDMDNVTVAFKTSNSKVATVSSKGVITTKKKGKAVISILVTKEGITEKVLVNLTVKDKKKVPSTVRNLGNVRVTKGGTPVITVTKELKVSGTSKIAVAKKEGVTVSYTSSDKNVVTVSQSGKITGKSAGSANVIANVKYNGVIQKYQVKVTVK